MIFASSIALLQLGRQEKEPIASWKDVCLLAVRPLSCDWLVVASRLYISLCRNHVLTLSVGSSPRNFDSFLLFSPDAPPHHFNNSPNFGNRTLHSSKNTNSPKLLQHRTNFLIRQNASYPPTYPKRVRWPRLNRMGCRQLLGDSQQDQSNH